MAETIKIMRKSVFSFLQNYHHFSSTAALIAMPFSASILLSQAILPSFSSSSLLFTIYSRIQALFAAAGFPASSEFFAILNEKLAQTISSSILTLPFTLTFFLVCKSYVIESLRNPKLKSRPSFSSVFDNFSRVFSTYLWSSILILAANATVFALLFLAFNSLESFGLLKSTNSVLFLSASGAVLYSIVLANTLIVCNLGLVSSGMERSCAGGGYLWTLRACVLIRGRTSTALALTLPLNLAMAAIEALFQYRIVRSLTASSSSTTTSSSWIVMEALLIFYLYSIMVVLDTVVNCVFYKNCKAMEELGRQLCYGIKDDDLEDDAYDYYVYDSLKTLALEQLP
ncbi:uncharacterized protein LOC133830639 [Humulus lupulus]|uniref:uncharacterized protein LOC133830639 n=1 Tax=Humulus lupulus TaxID=3486 RepID=UPI002B40F76D|nr:uncharacterized protein LOC133830639 [Humulus lupulus]